MADTSSKSDTSLLSSIRDLSDEDISDPLSPKLVNIDQAFLCFDVEQASNAKQIFELTRAAHLSQAIVWRIRTNAPTEFIVNPTRGIFSGESKPAKVTVELVDNHFNPCYKLVVQAMALPENYDAQSAWNHQNAKEKSLVQTIRLKLSTVLMDIQYTTAEEKHLRTKSSDSLESIMAQSSTNGLERVAELEKMLNLIESETADMRKAFERTVRLKHFLEKALNARKLCAIERRIALIELRLKTKKYEEQLARDEAELTALQQRAHMENCVIS